MDTKILVPSMGESIVEATVVHWYKKVGDPVQTGEPLLELETNKANLDIGAEQSGTLSRIEKEEGQDVRVGDTLGILAAGEAARSQPAPQPSTPAREQVPAPAQEKQAETTPLEQTAPPETAAETSPEEKITPVARRIARENNLDLARISGSGPGGKVLKEDVEKALGESKPRTDGQENTSLPHAEEKTTTAPSPAAQPTPTPEGAEEPSRPAQVFANPPSPVSQRLESGGCYTRTRGAHPPVETAADDRPEAGGDPEHGGHADHL